MPVIFDQSRLMDDILFAVSFGLNSVFSKFGESATSGANNPEDENAGRTIWCKNKNKQNVLTLHLPLLLYYLSSDGYIYEIGIFKRICISSNMWCNVCKIILLSRTFICYTSCSLLI